MSVAYHDGMKQSRKCGSGSPSKATDGSGRDAAKMGTKTNTRTRAIIVVAAILLIAAIVGTVFLVRSLTASPDSSKTDDAQASATQAFPKFSFGDTTITQAEFTQAWSSQRTAAVSYFKQKHDVNLNVRDADWTASYGGEKPVEWLTKQTIDTLRFRHAAYLIAVSYGLVDDDSYTGIVKRMETLNANNRQKREAGQVIYGRSEYDIASYIDYEMTALKNDYVDDATKPGMNPSETEVQEFYDAHDWTVDGVEGKAPLADVKANVKTALRTERYRERVQSKADKIDVSTLPWKRLYAYAATLVG